MNLNTRSKKKIKLNTIIETVPAESDKDNDSNELNETTDCLTIASPKTTEKNFKAQEKEVKVSDVHSECNSFTTAAEVETKTKGKKKYQLL